MADASYLRLQVIVFALVSASFTNIYITQPVLPVLGRMGGRLLGGWIYPPLHWRYAFVSASILILIATFAALRGLPRTPVAVGQRERSIGFLELLKHWEYLRLYFCAAGSFAIFSPIFNYLPFRLNGPPFRFSTELTTLVYLVQVIGIFMGPTAGRISTRVGSSHTLLGGAAILGGSLGLVLIPSLAAVMLGLFGICTGFFTIHAAAVGSLNRKLSRGQGRANALYVIFYYTGGWLGITGSGFAYRLGGWSAVVYFALFLLIIPLSAGMAECKITHLRTTASS